MSENTGRPPIHLLANSYDLQALEKATEDAEKVKADERDDAFGKIARDQALRQDVIEGLEKPAVPEGHELGKIQDASGREVEAPVPVLAEDAATGAEDTTSRRRATPDKDAA